jgi:hypothetical protein
VGNDKVNALANRTPTTLRDCYPYELRASVVECGGIAQRRHRFPLWHTAPKAFKTENPRYDATISLCLPIPSRAATADHRQIRPYQGESNPRTGREEHHSQRTLPTEKLIKNAQYPSGTHLNTPKKFFFPPGTCPSSRPRQ